MNTLPETGFLRLPQIIGQEEITEQQAAENKKRGKGPMRQSPGTPAIIPVKKTCWWDGVKAGRFPKPVKLGPRVTVWRVEDIRALLNKSRKA